MKISPIAAVVSSALFSLYATPAIANVTDVSVESKNTTFYLSPSYSKNHYETIELRVTLTNLKTGKQKTSPWTTEKSLSIDAEYGETYDIVVESRNTSTGEIRQFVEEAVSLTSTGKAKTQKQSTQASINAVTGWESAFTLDATDFPMINITADLKYDELSFNGDVGQLPLLTQSSISVEEDGRYEAIDRFVQPDPASSKKIVDIVFVHDDSGSLDDEAAQVRENITNFVSALTNENFDYRIGLLPYGGNAYRGFSGPSGTVLHNGALTSDPLVLQADIDSMQFDGGTERAFDAVYKGITETLWRPNTQKVVILVTDENNDSGSISESVVTNALVDNNILFYGLTAGHDEFDRMASAVSGQVFNIRSDFSSILQEIGADLSSRYIVQYETDNSNYDGVERLVDFNVSGFDSADQAISETFSLSYTPVVPVEIGLSDATLALLSKGLLPSTAIPISVTTLSEEPLTSMKLGYKNSAQGSFTVIPMSEGTSGYWSAEIPADQVLEGSLTFYIVATTATGTKTLPSVDPESIPFALSVLPNVPPKLAHDPVTTALANTDIAISAFGEDASNEVAEVRLYYREVGSPLFEYIATSFNTTTANFNASIPAEVVTTNGVEYYLVAEDDFGVETQLGSVDSPYSIVVQSDELPAECNDFANVQVCADAFSYNAEETFATASGNVKIGRVAGTPVLGFSGAVTIDVAASEVASLGPGRLRALKVHTSNAGASDINLSTMSFTIDGNSSLPLLTPSVVFNYKLNNALISGSDIEIDSNAVNIDSSVDMPLYTDYSSASGKIIQPLSLGDLTLAQSAGQSSLEVTLNLDDVLSDNSLRVGKFGGSGLSVAINSVTYDFLQPGIAAVGEINWNQKAYELGSEFSLNPVDLEAVSFAYTNLARSSFFSAAKIPLLSTGFVVAHSKTALEWRRLPEFALSGSINGYFSDTLGGMASVGNTLGKHLLSGSMGVTISNGAKTWTASGNLQLLESFDLFSTSLTAGVLPSGQAGMQFTSRLNIAQIVIGNSLFNAQSGSAYTQFRSKSDVTLQLPNYVPVVGGTSLASASGETLIRVDHTRGDDLTAYTQGQVQIALVKLGVRVDYSDPTDIDVSLLKKSTQNGTQRLSTQLNSTEAAAFDFTVGAGEESIFFTANTSQGLPQLELQLPNGDTLVAADYLVSLEDLATSTSPIVYFDNGNNTATFVIASPDAGNYSVNVVNDADLTGLAVTSIVPMNAVDTSIATSVTTVATGDSMDINYDIGTVDGSVEAEFMLRSLVDTSVDIYLDTVEQSTGSFTSTIAIPETIVPGEYQLVMVTRGASALSQEIIADSTITVENTLAPTAPATLSATFGDGNAQLSWPATTDSIDGYIIRVTNLTKDDSSVIFVDPDATEYSVDELTNGDTYRFDIAASTDTGIIGSYTASNSGEPIGTFVTGAPDLAIDSSTMTLTSATELRGEPIVVTAELQNSGDYPAYSSRFNCYFGSIQSSTLVSSTLLGLIEPDTSVPVECAIDQSDFDTVGDEIFFTITDAVMTEKDTSNNVSLIENPYSANIAPEAVDDDVTTDEDTALEIDVLANDTDANEDSLVIESFTEPSFGQLTLQDNKLLYTPDLNANGLDSFQYVVSDGELSSQEAVVFIDIIPVNDAPVITVQNALDLSEGDTATITVQVEDAENDAITIQWTSADDTLVSLTGSDQATVTLDSHFVSEDTNVVLQVVANDGQVDTTQNVTVTVLNDNHAPELTIDAPAEANEGESVTATVTATDQDNDELTVDWTQTAGTTVTLTDGGDNTVSFTAPDVSSDEVLTFEVTVSDGEHSTVVTKSITIKASTSNSGGSDSGSSSDSSGGSLGFGFLSLLLPLAIIRRLRNKK